TGPATAGLRYASDGSHVGGWPCPSGNPNRVSASRNVPLSAVSRSSTVVVVLARKIVRDQPSWDFGSVRAAAGRSAEGRPHGAAVALLGDAPLVSQAPNDAQATAGRGPQRVRSGPRRRHATAVAHLDLDH